MADSKADSKQDKALASSAGASSSDSPQRAIEDVYRRYNDAMRDAGLAAQRRVGEAQRTYAQKLQAAQQDLYKEMQSAHEKYGKALQDAAGSNEKGAQLAATAHQEYVDASQTAQIASCKRWEEITRELRDADESARAEYLKTSESTYRTFLKELQSAWTRVDVGTIDVQQASQLGQLVMAATANAQRAFGSV